MLALPHFLDDGVERRHSADDEEISSEINSTKPLRRARVSPPVLADRNTLALRMAVSCRSEAPLEGASLAKPLVTANPQILRRRPKMLSVVFHANAAWRSV